MIKLSVNLNKVALLRNSRGSDNPGPLFAAETCIAAGAHGITLHLREDRRHAREVPQIAEVSIGHALIADALYLGLEETVKRYVAAAAGMDVPVVRTR